MRRELVVRVGVLEPRAAKLADEEEEGEAAVDVERPAHDHVRLALVDLGAERRRRRRDVAGGEQRLRRLAGVLEVVDDLHEWVEGLVYL